MGTSTTSSMSSRIGPRELGPLDSEALERLGLERAPVQLIVRTARGEHRVEIGERAVKSRLGYERLLTLDLRRSDLADRTAVDRASASTTLSPPPESMSLLIRRNEGRWNG